MNDNLSCLPELCLQIWQKDARALPEIQRLARSRGLTADLQDGQVSTRGKVGTAVTLGLDPITPFVALAFGFVGASWASDPQISQLFNDTKKRWKQAAKAARGR